MLRIYIWDAVGTPIDGEAWADMVLDMANSAAEGARSAYRVATADGLPPPGSSRVLPDIYGDDMSPRWGHAGMGFRDVAVGERTILAYRAFWPQDPVNWPLVTPETGTIYTSLEADIASEGGHANHVFTVPTSWQVDEAGVWTQWEQWRASPPGYAASGFNCCASIARSIATNMDSSSFGLEARYMLATPEPNNPISLLNWLTVLQRAIP